MNTNINGKVCVVTGAAGVLCSRMVHALAAAGAHLALLGRTQSKLDAVAKELTDAGYTNHIAVAADVCDRSSLEAAHIKIKEALGPIDILVNGAGGNNPKATTSMEIMTDEEYTKDDSFFGINADAFVGVFGLNFIGTLLPCLVFAKDMADNKSGVILNISSMSAQLPLTKVPAYSAAKAAVDNFTKWLSVHFAQRGIRVNALAPGFFVSDQNRFLLYEQDGSTLTARGKKIISQTPMQRFGEADELQDSVVFLCSPASTFITGIVLPVDGGFSAFSGV